MRTRADEFSESHNSQKKSSELSTTLKPLESQTCLIEPSVTPPSPPPARNRKRWWWLLLSVLILGGSGLVVRQFLYPTDSPPEAAQLQPQAVPVKLQQLLSSTIQDSSSFVGNLEAQQGVVLRPKTQGRVTRIFVQSGAPVTRGQPIIELSPDKSRAEFSAALATVNAAQAARNNAQAQLRAVKAERARAAAELELQNTEFDRTASLVAQGVQTQQQLDRVKRDRATALASLNAANEQIQAAEASVQEANATLAQAAGNAAATREDVQDTQVIAPIAGVVGNIPVKLGDYISIGDTLTTITQNQTLDLEFSVPIERKDQLRIGLPVELVQFQSDTPMVRGQIRFISPRVNSSTQAILAKASFPNPNGRLKDAQRVEAKLIWQERPGVLVPASAISRLGGKSFVFVAEQSDSAEPAAANFIARQRPVQLGNLQGNDYQVLEGLRPGETIVASGILNLSDGVMIEGKGEG